MENNISLWKETTKECEKYLTLNKDIQTDILIIGAGLTGLQTAYYLTKKGYKVVIIDKDEICMGTSGYTTGKITSQHGLIYKYLIDSKGLNFAKEYLDANEIGLNNIVNIIKEEKIECDLERKPNFVYAKTIDELEKVNEEVEAVKMLNENVVEFTKKIDIPLKTLGAIKFNNQAQFNSRKYAIGLANIITKNGGIIYENLRAININKLDIEQDFNDDEEIKKDDDDLYVDNNESNNINSTKRLDLDDNDMIDVTVMNFNNSNINNKDNNKNEYYNDNTNIEENQNIHHIKCNKLVIATHYPIKNFPGMYFFKMYQEFSYVVAVKPNVKNLKMEGMYINTKNPKLSIRTAKDINGDELVLFIGNNSKTGEKESLKDKYIYLIEEAKKMYPKMEVKYTWNTEDCITLDKIPYIGKYSMMLKNIFVATGYNKWGMTTSNVAANILTDLVENKMNIYSELYSSTRLEPVKNSKEMSNMLNETINSLVINKFKKPKEDESELVNMELNSGKILLIDGKKIAVYKNEKGEYLYLEPKCQHLGCEITWNDLDKTWDCPCHGSRYEADGKLIFSPSVKDLNIIKEEKDSKE